MSETRILQLCKKFPYPVKDGESLAIDMLGKGLHEAGCGMDMLAMNTRRHPGMVQHPSADSRHYGQVQAVDVDNRVKAIPALLNLFSPKSYHISRFESDAYRDALIRLLQKNKYGIVLLETLYLCPYIPAIREWSGAKIVLRAHNLEQEIWQRIVQNGPKGPKKWYLSHLTRKLARYETAQIRQVDYLAAITDRDWRHFQGLGYTGRGAAVPIGLDVGRYGFQRLDAPSLSAGFIGSMDWMPNTTGLDWFIREVWPGLSAELPGLALEIAGRNCPQSWLDRSEGRLRIIGEVEDAQAFTLRHPIMVVPLLAGSGMRVKILEGMALGRVVISTRVGLEGIPAQHQKEVWVADTPSEFLAAFRHFQQHPGRMADMGAAARAFVEKHFGYQQIAARFLADLEQKNPLPGE